MIGAPVTKNCPLCGTPATQDATGNPASPTYVISCEVCEAYSITFPALDQVQRAHIPRGSLRGWIYDQRRLGAPVTITTEVLEAVARSSSLTVEERFQRLLVELSRLSNIPPGPIGLTTCSLSACLHSDSIAEVQWMAEYLDEQGLVTIQPRPQPGRAPTPSQKTLTLTHKGVIETERLRTASGKTAQGFVAMWFDESMNEVYDKAIGPAVEGAGYRPFRVDRTEHVNRIDDEIVLNIRRSRFLVADLTGHRQAVYFEAGLAFGLGLPVFYTCRHEDMVGNSFDTRQYNCIDWDELDDLRLRLRDRIEAVLGQGPTKHETGG